MKYFRLMFRRGGVACAAVAAVLFCFALAHPAGAPPPGEGDPAKKPVRSPHKTEFTFVRSVYNGLGPWGYYKAWYTDWPKADRQFILGIKRLTNVEVSEREKTIPLTDPDLFHYPFIYAVEVGHFNLTDAEAASLGEYLKRGGFLFCDDFWGSAEWANFTRNMQQVLPGSQIVEIPLDHPLFHCYYDIPAVIQVPNVGNAVSQDVTYEQDGIVPHCRGIFDENDRLMVVINWNTDLGDAWEWADLPGYPTKYSTYAYQLGINAIVYAMSH